MQFYNRNSSLLRSTLSGSDSLISVKVPVPSSPICCPNHPGPRIKFILKKNAMRAARIYVNTFIPRSFIKSLSSSLIVTSENQFLLLPDSFYYSDLLTSFIICNWPGALSCISLRNLSGISSLSMSTNSISILLGSIPLSVPSSWS